MMTKPDWCQCKINEPKIEQIEDTLVCHWCNRQKKLPPHIDLKWERVKRQFLAYGKTDYKTYTKEALIEMLLKRDAHILEEWNKVYKGTLILSKAEFKERFVKPFIHYLVIE